MDGILIIDKPVDFTSHDVVAKCRKILQTKKIGHTGTLDPFATGVLVILIGKATRLAQFLDKDKKEYIATVRLGFETDTGDLTGRPKSEAGSRKSVPVGEIENVLACFRGEIEQIPPMYSAKKVDGKKLYNLARKGIEIERKPVNVVIYELALIEETEKWKRGGAATEFNAEDSTDFGLKVVCSAGTYIRTLAEDIGRKLGTGAHLAALRRTRAGKFGLEKSVTLEKLAELAQSGEVETVLLTMNEALEHLSQIILNAEELQLIANGMPLKLNQSRDVSFAAGQMIRLADDSGSLAAIGLFEAETELIKPKIVFQESNKNSSVG